MKQQSYCLRDFALGDLRLQPQSLPLRSSILTVIVLTVVAAPGVGLAADSSSASSQEQALIEKLRSDAPEAEKAMTCKKLAVYGSKEAVPAIAPLLENPRLCSWARIALEAIPGLEADQALLAATNKVQGRQLVGVINSLGFRRHAGAVEALSAKLKDGDVDVASAAAAALGNIGGDNAINALRPALATAPAAVRSAVAEGCVLAAERLAHDGKKAEAANLYDAVRSADVPKPRVLDATRGAILARDAEGIPLLLEQLRSADNARFQLGVTVAREMRGKQVSEAVAAEIGRAAGPRAALLTLVLKDRQDQTASPAVIEMARSGAKPLRIAALGVLRRAGDASCVPMLLEIAVDQDAEIATAARSALAEMPDKQANAEIAKRLATAEGPALKVLIETAGLRRVSATPALKKALDSPDAQVRAAALAALGATIELDDLKLLIARTADTARPEDAEAARLALRSAAVRMANREACAEMLVAAMQGAPAAKQAVLLDVIGAVGGSKALAAMAAAGKQSDPQLQDIATKALGQWMTVDAAPVLLDLATTAPSEKYKTRALRGGIRIVRQFTMPDRQRAELCRQALKAATRAEEQKLVLQVLARYTNVDSLAVAVEAAQTPALKDEATRTAAGIAKKLTGQDVDSAMLLAQLQKPVKLEIMKAQYGAAASQKDVTEALRRQARDLPLIGLPSPSYNESFGGDPIVGTAKQLRVQYRINGVEGNASFAENAVILLPTPK